MGHKCYISFKTQDSAYKKEIQDLNIDMIDKSLNEAIDSDNEDYIMRKIREEYLADSTVTIFLIGLYSAENSYFQNQTYIKRELQASLYNSTENTRNGILGIVLPPMTEVIYQGNQTCISCGSQHSVIKLDDSTVIKEFWRNYYIEPHTGCAWNDDERYCMLVKWESFKSKPELYIDQAFDKRTEAIADKVKVYPK